VGGFQPAVSAVGALALSTTFRGNRIGAAVKYVDQRTGSLHDGAPSLDLGLARDVSRYTVGVTVQNIGDGIHFQYGSAGSASLPLRVSAGVTSYGWTVGPLDVNGSAGASVLPDGDILPAFGLEFGYAPLEGYKLRVQGRDAAARAPRATTVEYRCQRGARSVCARIRLGGLGERLDAPAGVARALTASWRRAGVDPRTRGTPDPGCIQQPACSNQLSRHRPIPRGPQRCSPAIEACSRAALPLRSL
jgi:hypothetical protein